MTNGNTFPEKISRSGQEEPKMNQTLNFDLKEKPKRFWSYIKNKRQV